MHKICMNAVIDFKIKGLNKANDDVTYEVGGFDFDIKNPKSGETIGLCFDFDAFCISNHEAGAIEYSTGKGLVFDDVFLSEDHYEEYEELGIKDDITAAILAATTNINEFVFAVFDEDDEYFNYDNVFEYCNIKTISFSDGENEFFVSQDVILACNLEYNKGSKFDK